MDRRFMCRECGTKWFIHEHGVDEPDLTTCGRCGGVLEKLSAQSTGAGPGWLSREGEGGLGEQG